MTWEKEDGTGDTRNPVGAEFLRAAASPPLEYFVQDVLIHCTVISTATAFRPGHYGDHSLNGTLVSAHCPLSLSAINTAVGRNDTLRETKLRRHHVRLSEKLQLRGIACDASRAILQLRPQPQSHGRSAEEVVGSRKAMPGRTAASSTPFTRRLPDGAAPTTSLRFPWRRPVRGRLSTRRGMRWPPSPWAPTSAASPW
jgi:hypothetical protein